MQITYQDEVISPSILYTKNASSIWKFKKTKKKTLKLKCSKPEHFFFVEFGDPFWGSLNFVPGIHSMFSMLPKVLGVPALKRPFDGAMLTARCRYTKMPLS